jgi:DNA-binding CsgD family transcriptional regulator/tetratricopeptide (TPR) repeat protein
VAAESLSERVIGRDRELAAADSFLDTVASGTAALLIESEAGMGRTTLWEAVLEAARGRRYRVLVARPTQAETGLSFAGLIDLLDGVPDDVVGDLPPPQRSALEVALLKKEAALPVESGAVSLAFVNLVRSLVRSGPIVIAVDDLEWLDRPTVRALEFALRRLRSEPIGVVTTQRPSSPLRDTVEQAVGGERTRRLIVGPVSMSALYQLVRGRLGLALARPILVRVHEAAGGNPLFGLELARSLVEKGGQPAPGQALTVSGRLNDLLHERLTRLPRRTQSLLLVAAAMSNPRLDDVRRAADLPTATDGAREIERAERAGVVEVINGAIRFTHPLLASTVYSDASASVRRHVHLRLAHIVADPEEQARHLAAGTVGPDASVASALDRVVGRAQARGATDVAAGFAEQAMGFTPPTDLAATCRRTLAAGTLALSAGDHARARTLLEGAVATCTPGHERAEALLRLAELAVPLRRGSAMCSEALDQAADNPSLQSRVHRLSGSIEYFLGNVAAAERHAQIGVALAEQADDAAALGMAVAELGHWTFCGGGGVRHDLFDRAIDLDPSAGAFAPRSHLAKVLMDAGSLDESRPLLEDLIEESTRVGNLQAAALHVFHLAELEAWAGNWKRALEYADESLLLRQHADQPRAPMYVKAMCLAYLGRLDEARREAQAGLAEAERNEDVVFVMQNLHVLGFADLSEEDYRAAHSRLGRATDLMRPRWNKEFGDGHFVPDEIESLIALGDLQRAEDLVEWMEEVGRRTDRAWTLASGGRCRALLLAARGALDEADQVLQRALTDHQRLPMPFELARTLLAKGTLERRRRRRAAGHSTLARARAIFEELGAPLWVRRVDSELARIGTRTEAQRGLTPVEAQIAHLVAEGHTNREIAASLFVSPKTVEANLSRVYRKLEIGSRAELAAWSSRRLPADIKGAPPES